MAVIDLCYSPGGAADKWAFGSWAKTGRANVLNAPNRPFLLHVVVDFFSLMHFFWLSLCRKMSNPFRWRLRLQDYSLNIHLKCSVFMHLVIRFDIPERKTSYPIYGKIPIGWHRAFDNEWLNLKRNLGSRFILFRGFKANSSKTISEEIDLISLAKFSSQLTNLRRFGLNFFTLSAVSEKV